MEVSIRNDPELAAEVITLLGKELKTARERIRGLESQIRHGNRGESIVIDSTESRESTDVIETIEKLTTENTALRTLLEESRNIQIRVKEEVTEEKFSIPPPEKHGGHDKLDLANKVKELEEALEVYYAKYKAQKGAKKTLRDSLSDLETQVKDLTDGNQKLQQAAELSSNPSQVTPMDLKQLPLAGQDKCVGSVFKFPKFDGRPHYKSLHPICHRGVDIAAYLSSDSNLEKFSKSFLYFPGRLLWCRFGCQHGMAFGPQHVFDAKENCWEMKSVFEEHGTYTCHNLHSWSPGSPMPTERVLNPHMLAEATIENTDFLDNSERKLLEKMIERLYLDRILKVEVMGLQCVGFNAGLYDTLDRRFQTSLPVSGKREGSQLDGRELTKKHRTTTS